jgi:hypothetical protein
MSDVRTTLLFTIKLGAAPPQMLGKTPLGERRICIGVGHRPPEGTVHRVFEVL